MKSFYTTFSSRKTINLDPRNTNWPFQGTLPVTNPITQQTPISTQLYSHISFENPGTALELLEGQKISAGNVTSGTCAPSQPLNSTSLTPESCNLIHFCVDQERHSLRHKLGRGKSRGFWFKGYNSFVSPVQSNFTVSALCGEQKMQFGVIWFRFLSSC